jgi:hypothetical protein
MHHDDSARLLVSPAYGDERVSDGRPVARFCARKPRPLALRDTDPLLGRRQARRPVWTEGANPPRERARLGGDSRWDLGNMNGEHRPEMTEGAASKMTPFTGKTTSGRYWVRTSDFLLVRQAL